MTDIKTDDNIDVKLELKQTPLRSKYRSVIIPEEGVGIRLDAGLIVDSGYYNLYSGIVRSIDRDALNDSDHFYTSYDPVVQNGDEVKVTLRSKTLEDTYVLNLKTRQVKLDASVDLTKLNNLEKITELIDSVDLDSFKDIVEKYESMAVSKNYVSGNMTPVVFPSFIDKSKDVAVVSVGNFIGSHDPYISDLALYLVKSDGSFQELSKLEVSENAPYEFVCRPKFSATSFQLENLVLENDSLKITGRSIFKDTSNGASDFKHSESFHYELPISNDYTSLDQFIE